MEEQYYHFVTNEIDTYFHKDLSDADKYMVCVCAKNENDYIEEWVIHYLNLGFDKIIICDNNDDESLLDVLSKYISEGTVEVFNCRGFGSFQVQFYSMFCTEGNYKWCAYFDADEFLELGIYSNIKEYLETKQNDVCINFNWIIFGSNGEHVKRSNNVQARFPLPTSPISLFTENCFIKSIVRGGDFFKNGCWFNGSHLPMTTPMYTHSVGGYYNDDSDSHQSFPPRYKEGYLKHYYTKSFEEWVKKSSRGWPDGTENLHLKNYFICDDWANLPKDRMADGLFIEEDIKEFGKNYENMFNKFDVIQVTNTNKHIYAYLTGVYRLMRCTSEHTFVISGDHIDDTTFNILLEYGFKTNNNVVWANNYDDVWRAYLKYNKGRNSTYFILNFL